jgi:hypothetical protein
VVFDWFSHGRPLEPIGRIPPAQAEEQSHAMLAQRPMGARLKPNILRQTRRTPTGSVEATN